MAIVAAYLSKEEYSLFQKYRCNMLKKEASISVQNEVGLRGP